MSGLSRVDIIRMAQEAGINVTEGNSFSDDMYISVLYRFANLVAAAEREACAKVCEVEGERVDASWVSCAFAIRERGAP
jgi:hypothetical protein